MKDLHNEFKLHHGFVSAEAMSINLPNRGLLTNFTNMISTFTTFMDKALPELDSKVLKNLNVDLTKREIDLIVKTPYKDLKLVMIAVPEGLSVDFLTYADTLLKLELTLKDLYQDTLLPFTTELGKVISRPKDSSSLINNIKLKSPDLEPMKLTYANCFKNKSTNVGYWDAFKRQSDIVPLLNTIDEIKKVVAHQPTKMISSKVTELSSMLYKIRDMINDPNSSLRPTADLIKRLSDVTYTLAELVSFYSMLSHSVSELAMHTERALLDTYQEVK